MARSKGVSRRSASLKHALRPSLFSFITVFAINTGAADRRRTRRRADLHHPRPRFGDHRGRGPRRLPRGAGDRHADRVHVRAHQPARRRHLHDHRSASTQMTQPMNTTITESPMAVQQAAVVADDTISRKLGPVFWIAVAVVGRDRPRRDPRTVAAAQGPREELHRPQPRTSPILALIGVLVRHRQRRARHVLADDLGGTRVAHGRLRRHRLRHAVRRIAGRSRGILPRMVGSRRVVRVRRAALVPRVGAGDPDHHLARSQVCRRSRPRSASSRSAPVGRLACATTIQFSEREFVVAARAVGASNRRIIVRELLPNVVIPMGVAGAARNGCGDRRRGRVGVLGTIGREGLDMGQVDPLRVREPHPREVTVGRVRADRRALPHGRVAQLLWRQGPRPLRRQGERALMPVAPR